VVYLKYARLSRTAAFVSHATGIVAAAIAPTADAGAMCTAAGSAAAIGSTIRPADARPVIVVVVVAIAGPAIIRIAKSKPYIWSAIVAMASMPMPVAAVAAMPAVYLGYLGRFAQSVGNTGTGNAACSRRG